MPDTPTFDDGRGKLPDMLHARVPRGFRAQIKRAAAAENLPASEFVRRAVAERIAAVANDDGPGPFRPNTGARAA